MRRVAILLFNDVEVLDFAGPFEVFSVCRTTNGDRLFDVQIVAEHDAIIAARNGLMIKPHTTIEDAEEYDIVVIPGGRGTRREMKNDRIKVWVKKQYAEVELMLSVCTGSLVLGTTGLLDGVHATTHHGAFDELAEAAPSTVVVRDKKYVDNGKIVTSAGISAGIEMALHVVRRLHGAETAERTANYMEYDWDPKND
ncbi:MAG: DJ-1/PfpI family protein [Saprospiraceae bacterium]|nr:DJ-1/PfpI family protein [Saprospiraceae bacterium]